MFSVIIFSSVDKSWGFLYIQTHGASSEIEAAATAVVVASDLSS